MSQADDTHTDNDAPAGDPPTPQHDEQTPAPPDDSVVMTKEEFDAKMKAARADGESRAERRLRKDRKPEPPKESKPKAKAKNDEVAPEVSELTARLERMELKDAFNQIALEKSIPAKQANFLFEMAAAQKPDDLFDFVERAIDTFGLSKEPSTTNSTETLQKTKAHQPPNPETPQQPPASDRGGPSRTSDGLLGDNPLRWNERDVAQIMGNANSRIEGVQEVRKRFMDGLRGVSIEFPRGPGK